MKSKVSFPRTQHNVPGQSLNPNRTLPLTTTAPTALSIGLCINNISLKSPDYLSVNFQKFSSNIEFMLKFTDFDSLWPKSLKCLCSSRRCVGRFKRFEVLEVNQHPPFWKIVVLMPLVISSTFFQRGNL